MVNTSSDEINGVFTKEKHLHDVPLLYKVKVLGVCNCTHGNLQIFRVNSNDFLTKRLCAVAA